MIPHVSWPEGRAFAFTVFDDTDLATLENVGPVYALLGDCGLRTTKSVWPLAGPDTPRSGGTTCEDENYRRWALDLKARGFEIGYHMATYHSSEREQTIRGLNRFADIFGCDPGAMANHSACTENIYWGDNRLTGYRRLAYNLLTRFKFRGRYLGHIEGDPHYWGDFCHERITYVRSFIYPDINTLKACPMMPYHDPRKPLVNFWFGSSEGPEINSFTDCLTEANQDRLEAEGGACIMYTHFGAGFVENGRINPRFESLMRRLSGKNGWFVPVSTLLDFLRMCNGGHVLTDRERKQLEMQWLRHKLRVGHS